MRKCMIADYIPDGQAYNVRKGTCLPGATRRPHCHEFLEIVFISSGKGTHFVNEESYSVKRGSVIFINCDTPHSFSSTEAMTYFNFYINPSVISKELSEIQSFGELLSFFFPEIQAQNTSIPTPLELDSAFLPEMQSCADGIYSEIRDKRQRYELSVDGYMRIVYTGILRAILPTASKRREIVSSDILDYVEKNYTRRITLTDIAARFFYNPVYLGKLFKSTYGTSFKHYVLEKRLSLAASLLKSGGMTVEMVTAAVGFSDKKFFYRCFKEKFGCTPLQYSKI